MTRGLGYERYGVQGGDWGAIVAAKLGAAASRARRRHPRELRRSAPPPPDPAPEDAEARRARCGTGADQEDALLAAAGAPSRDSLTVAQTDSPAGLAAWIVEKFRTWSDCDGDVERLFAKDALLTNLMFYWAPGSVASAARIYYESARDPAGVGRARARRGAGRLAAFPHEIFRPPRAGSSRTTTSPAGRTCRAAVTSRRSRSRSCSSTTSGRSSGRCASRRCHHASRRTRCGGGSRGRHGPRWRAGSAHGPCRRG